MQDFATTVVGYLPHEPNSLRNYDSLSDLALTKLGAPACTFPIQQQIRKKMVWYVKMMGIHIWCLRKTIVFLKLPEIAGIMWNLHKSDTSHPIFIGNHGAPGGKEGHRGTLACAPAASSTTAALLPTQLGPGRSLRRGGNLSEVQPVFAWMFQYGGKP